MRSIALALAMLALAGCAGGPPRSMPRDRIDAVLAGAPGEAQPSRIVALESAFARAAREEGQWTAFDRFAAPDALIHGRNGTIPAKPWLAAQKNPPAAVQWAPREIWMSCDARLAISTGRFRDPDGTVGNFVTVWQRQADGEYRWTYDMGAPDVPQPEIDTNSQLDPGSITVSAMDAVRGHVSDCRKDEAASLPPMAVPLYPDGTVQGGGRSPDGTLEWRWAHLPDGTRLFDSSYLHDREAARALSLTFAPRTGI